MIRRLIAEILKQSCRHSELSSSNQGIALCSHQQRPWPISASFSKAFLNPTLLPLPAPKAASPDPILQDSVSRRPVSINPVSRNPVVLNLPSHCQLVESFSWNQRPVLKPSGGANVLEAAECNSWRNLHVFPPVEKHGGAVSLAASVSEVPAIKASGHNATFNRHYSSGSEKGPKQVPEQDEPFLTPFDIVRRQLADEESNANEESYSKEESHSNEESRLGGSTKASSALIREEESLWKESSESTTGTGQSQEAVSVEDMKPKTIEFLDVHKEKMAELKALEELTFDDVSRWSSEGIAPDRQERAASALTECKLHLIGAFYELQIVPMRKLFSWAIPTEEALQAIKEASPNGVVEVGAGSGYWAALLRERGVNVRAFDRAPVDSKYNGHHSPITSEQLEALGKWVGRTLKVDLDVELVQRLGFGSVNEGGPEEAGGYPGRSLLLCWPPDETDSAAPTDVQCMGVNALNAYRGSTLIYVGEKVDGEASTSEQIDGAGTSSSGAIDGGVSSSERISKSAGPKFAKKLRKGGWALQKEVVLPHWPQCEDTLQILTREIGHVATPEPPEPAGDRSVPRLRERLEALASAAKAAGFDPAKTSGFGFGFKVVRDDEETRRLKQEALNLMNDVDKSEKEARDARMAPLAREVYMRGLRALWDDVARELIWRRVHKEGLVRGCHTPFSPIEEAITERHMARQGLIRRLLLRYTYYMMKRMEDKQNER